ncbi:ACT domain-containing protein ACR4 [Zea mays]|uniref:ACT domain-containing protein ACR n=1 Tax=Zea mays TaxID=4577 RepID=A0A1D6PYE8_MAIZE|nr:ACT domain-containing protein ACR4 [Zea mays]
MACGSRSRRTSETVDEYEKLVLRMNPPRVTVDNDSDMTATLVDSANKYGTLLEVVQVLTDLKLTINRAYISSDGEWFMDVFHVVDQDGNKLYDGQVIDRIEQSLGAGSLSFRGPPERLVAVEAEAEEAQTTIELVGRDRPGLLSEVFAVLADLRCNVVASEVWTHDGRVAALVHVTDADTLGAIDDPARLDTVKRLLRHVLRGSSRDKKAARAAVSSARVEHAPRRLHQMMQADRSARREGGGDGDGEEERERGEASGNGNGVPVVAVEDCAERGYTLVNVRCRDRPKLLFDTVCTLTDMQYVVFHGTVIAEGSEAYQEYYIRHLDDSSGEDRDRLCRGLEAAIQRRCTEVHVHAAPVHTLAFLSLTPGSSQLCLNARGPLLVQGLRLELCCEDRVGLLSDVTRIFREHGLSVTHAEVETRGARAANVFYVVDASGEPVQAQAAVDAVRAEIGEQVLLLVREQQQDAAGGPKSPAGAGGRRSLGNMIRSRSEKFLYNLGLIRSCS